MTRDNKERLAGLIAGAYLLRTTDCALKAIVQQVILTNWAILERFKIAALPLLACVLWGFLGVAYLQTRRQRWLYVVTIVLLSIAACFYVSLIAISPFLPATPFSGTGVISGIGDLIIIAGLGVCVVALMKSDGRPNHAPEPTALAGTARSGHEDAPTDGRGSS